ncbi:NADH dehydrogenase [ubiquinone] 1 beta subcomplex subunit 8, mitochondrial-like [Convolutriloba macropyga]|uniref:NADH dehydrogenase [ubiquinone] 1 beta subcomplex subunit 8, mitochondrial-like n=1 Tax=Convolutriloba macropyga TaxID=536237 RepID=UPI003F521F40
MSLNKLLFKSAMRAAVLSPSSVRALTPLLVRHGSHRSPTEHPESTFGKDSFQSGISHKHTDPPHTDMTNAGAGVIILPDEQLPDNYPVTAEDWMKSARKYGIPIEEYKPYPDDGYHNKGDYPDFAPVHGLSRDFWHDWDMPPTKSDWGHVLHYEELDLTAFTEDIFSPTVEPLWKGFLRMFAYAAVFMGLVTYTGLYMPYHGIMAPKVYLHGWDPRTKTFNPENVQIMYRFPEHPPHYAKSS